ncbi:septum formation initiator family protein [Schaalia sp. 19OD2882]|uniref:FtsB family cell division protein n=1 Tax=Schaalia sp. 19OD2882 TaxID=2794089 RepID=UPI001C1EDAB9|nr:septum formation initiator family protein [Schaalia sp. 19OD2882]QWW20187.1 septum formation initiator family protein [Schaalia sp. 19OD2882]
MASTSGPSRPRPPRRSARQGGSGAPGTPSAGRTGRTPRAVGALDSEGRPVRATPRTRPQGGEGDAAERAARRIREAGKRRRARRERASTGPDLATTFDFGGVEISVRFLGIALLAGFLALMLVPSLFQWWSQEQELRRITTQVDAASERNAKLQEQLELWQDPEFVASQARERLGYVKPGETQYTVVDPGKEYLDQARVAAAADEGPARPWLQVVALSIQSADSTLERPDLLTHGQSGSAQSGPSGASTGQSAQAPQSDAQ